MKVVTPFYRNTWPIEYTMDSALSDEKKYNDKMLTYITEYLNALKVNSNGQEIFYDKNPNATSLIDVNSKMQNMRQKYEMILAENNAIVANWLDKNYTLILLILLIFIIFIIKIQECISWKA